MATSMRVGSYCPTSFAITDQDKGNDIAQVSLLTNIEELVGSEVTAVYWAKGRKSVIYSIKE